MPMSASSLASPQEEQLFSRLIEQLAYPFAIINGNHERVYTSQSFTDALGYQPEDIPNMQVWWESAHPDPVRREAAQVRWDAAVREAAGAQGRVKQEDYEITCKSGELRSFEVSGVVSGEHLLVIFNDVTELRQERARLVFGNAILQRISSGERLTEVLNFIVREIETCEAGMICSLLLLDDAGLHLRTIAAPSVPEKFCQALDGLAIGPAVGACGTAAYSCQDVFVGDVASDPLFADFRDITLGHGLAACWSSPIKSSKGTVLGTFATYWPSPQSAVSANTRRYVETATALAAIAIESARRELELRNAYRGLLRAEVVGQLGSWSWDVAAGVGTWSSQMFLLFGLDPNGQEPTPAEFVELIHPDDQSRVVDALALMQAGEKPPIFAFRRHPALGGTCYLQPSISLETDANGVIISLEGTLVDVTENRQAELRLHQQLSELQRWQQVTLGRESRVIELKAEVNALLAKLDQAPRYPSAIGIGASAQ